MDSTPVKQQYLNQLDDLKCIIISTNGRIILDPPDELIVNNANFFSKSFLVVMCAYLESYLKDSLMVIVTEINNRLTAIKVPHNLIKWSLNLEKEFKENEFKFENLKLNIKRKELDDYISGNPFKTTDLFKKFGIKLDKDQIFNNQKELINTIVTKRNKIVHHNDEASDVSNSDLISHIDTLKLYIENIDKIICNHLN